MSDPKWQWSIKLDNGEIFVTHAETYEELILNRDQIMAGFNPNNIIAKTSDPNEPTVLCKICGKPAKKQTGTNKNGNPYTLWKCSANFKHNWFEN